MGKSDAHRSDASVQLRHLSEGSMATSGHSLTRSSNAHPIGSSDAPSEDPMAMQEKEDNGYKLLIRLGGLYKRLTPAIFMLLEFRETSYT